MRSDVVLTKITDRPTPLIPAYVALTKPRISLLVVVTAAVGYLMAAGADSNWGRVMALVLGTALMASSANAMNQVIERDADAKMRRTASRPLPSGRLSPESAFSFGLFLAVTGTLLLLLLLNPLTALLGMLTWASYIFLYTPLKQRTPLNTWVGALPGALPPVGGWAAATGGLAPEASSLFFIVFFWQIPHFLAIATLLRKDYERAGFRMFPVVDPEGRRTARHLLGSAVATGAASLLPVLWSMAGSAYLLGAILLSTAYLGLSLWLALRPGTIPARWLFLGSIIHLPLLLGLMLFDRVGV